MSDAPPDDALLDAAEVAAWLDVDEAWLAKAVAQRALPVMGYTSSGLPVVCAGEVRAWLRHPDPEADEEVRTFVIATPHGPAHVHVHAAEDPRAAVVLGHGAGGGVSAPDLVAVTQAAVARGVTVALVEQPYRVAGRRSPAPARQLDAAWIAVVDRLVDGPLSGLPLVTGGRSSGARVACRTAAATGATAVLCLAFPLHPPGRPERSRLHELATVTVPVLVIQGARDPFGMPPPGIDRRVTVVDGDHGLKTDVAAVAAAVGDWFGSRLAG